MGGEQSSTLTHEEIHIPTSLKYIYSFLHDAHLHFSMAHKLMQHSTNQPQSISLKRLGVSHVDHAFKLLEVLNLDMDEEGNACLQKFRSARDHFAAELGLPPAEYEPTDDQESLTHNQTLLMESDSVLSIAEEQNREEFKTNAKWNYHTAAMFYRLLDASAPIKSEYVVQRLFYAAWRTTQLSSLSENLCQSYFSGLSCSSVYEIHGSEKLGKGSYGSVYLATHRRTGDKRAIKVMNVDRVTSYYLRKLHTEISILKSLDHPNIVKIQEVFFGKHSVYLVTDLCKGGELFELLNSGKSQGFVFREDRASKLMSNMMSAVQYLHVNGIVHRDLKLENFLFEEQSSNSALVLIDFGLSRRVEVDEKMTQRVGSCYYTAPEILLGSYDYRCDIWSLGVLCYMILSGSPPFYGRNVEDVYAATLNQEPVFPDSKFKHISPFAIDFIKRLLVKDPDQRMSIEEACSHPFITYEKKKVLPINSGTVINRQVFSPKVAEDIVSSMTVFVKAPPLIKLVLLYVASKMGNTKTDFLRAEYLAIDNARSGFITLESFHSSLMIAPSVLCGDVDLYLLYDLITDTASKPYGISFHEYIAAACANRLEVEGVYVEECISMLDPTNTGVISMDSTRRILGDSIMNTELKNMLSTVNGFSGEELSRENFLEFWVEFWTGQETVMVDDERASEMDEEENGAEET